MLNFSYRAFGDLESLAALKQTRGLTVGVALPSLNEVETVAKVIDAVRNCAPIVDDLIVVDSGSTDGTVELCEECGVRLVADSRAAAELGVPLSSGKGFNLWTSLHYLKSDIIAWMDADIRNANRNFILGIVGPMIVNDRLQFVKGYYRRPKGDARVTEILVRPYVSMLFPELAEFVQPLSGEYGGRRSFLRSLQFYSGYSVEIAVLLQARLTLCDHEVGQSFLGRRFHQLQSVSSLGKMGASILHTLLEMSRQYGRIEFNPDVLHEHLIRFSSEDGEAFEPESVYVCDQQLAPMEGIVDETGT